MSNPVKTDDWQILSVVPKAHEWVVVKLDDNYDIYKWKPYKADARRQGYPEGRWQKQEERGDYFRWVNQAPPAGSVWCYPRRGVSYGGFKIT